MIDIEKQIEYWLKGAEEDLSIADLLIRENRFIQGLFFCHLVIEKVIKAIVVKVTNDFPPRTHNLIFLSEKANLKFDEDDEIFIGILMKYQLQGRYPDYNPILLDIKKVTLYFEKTNQLFLWLKKIL